MCEVKHFLYKSDPHSQLLMCLPQQPYAQSKQHRKWLFRRYQHVLARIGATTGEIGDSSSADLTKIGAQALAHKKHQFYLEMSDFANLFCGQFLCGRTHTRTTLCLGNNAAQRHLFPCQLSLLTGSISLALALFPSAAVQRPGEYTLLVTFSITMTDKTLIMAATQKILKWIQKESANLFI